MNKKMRKWTAGAVLSLALCGVTVGISRGDDDDDKLKAAILAAKEAIEKLDGPMTPADAEKLAKEHKMEATMKLFKPKSKGGISIGDLTKGGKGHKDSIELLIRDYTINAPTKAEVDKYNKELVKSAVIAQNIAQMTPYWAPPKDGPGGKTKAKWMELSKEMQEGSADLVKGAKAKDDKAVEAAAKRLNTSCAECHKIFRDDK